MKEIDPEIRTWLDRIDTLLRKLYWESAYIRIETAYIGTHQFTWQVSTGWMENMCKGDVKPITEWRFESTVAPEELESLGE